jgi:hypothetical protein
MTVQGCGHMDPIDVWPPAKWYIPFSSYFQYESKVLYPLASY